MDRDAEASLVEGEAEVEEFGRMMLGPIGLKLVEETRNGYLVAPEGGCEREDVRCVLVECMAIGDQARGSASWRTVLPAT